MSARNDSAHLDIDAQIRELNLTYLLSIRAVTDAREAALRYGLSHEEVETIREASVEDIRSMASPGIMLFRPRGRMVTTVLKDPRGSDGALLSALSAGTQDGVL